MDDNGTFYDNIVEPVDLSGGIYISGLNSSGEITGYYVDGTAIRGFSERAEFSPRLHSISRCRLYSATPSASPR